MYSIVQRILLVIISCMPLWSCGKRFAGPYEVIFKAMSLCDDVGEGAFIYGTKFSKINRTHVAYTTNYTAKYGFTDSMQMALDFSVFGNGGYQDNFMHIGMNKACTDTLKLLPGVVETIAFSTAGKAFPGCPIPPGVYEVKRWIFNLRFAMPVFPYNKYKVKIRIFENGKLLTCCVLDMDVVPLEEKRRKH